MLTNTVGVLVVRPGTSDEQDDGALSVRARHGERERRVRERVPALLALLVLLVLERRRGGREGGVGRGRR
jgi:hypothetical protein